jgi:hypothetical protein
VSRASWLAKDLSACGLLGFLRVGKRGDVIVGVESQGSFDMSDLSLERSGWEPPW